MCSNCERNDVAILAARSFYQYVGEVLPLAGNEKYDFCVISAWERLEAWAANSKGRALDEEAAEVEISAFARSVGEACRIVDTDVLERAARCMLSVTRMRTSTFGDDADYDRALANAHPDTIKGFVTVERHGRPFRSATQLREDDKMV